MPINAQHKYSYLHYLLIVLASILFVSIMLFWKIYNNNNLQKAYHQKIAFMLADDIINKMYTNYKELLLAANSSYITDNPKQQILIQQNANYACYNTKEGCSPSAVAANDIINWQLAIKNNLFNGIGNISWVEADNSINIKISWNNNKHKPQKMAINKTMIVYSNHHDSN